MKKQFLLGVFLMLAACAGSGGKRSVPAQGGPDLSADPLDRIVNDIADNSERFQNKKIVVYEFQDIGGRLKAEGRLIAERLTTKLVRTGKFEVIERGRLESVLQELRLSASGAVDDKTALKAGEILGAGAVVTGTLVRVDGQFEINARAINVAGGKILTASIAEVSEASLRVAAEMEVGAPAQARFIPQQPALQRHALVLDGPLRERLLPNWEIWPGLNNSYGRFDFFDGRLSYYLSQRQHDGAVFETGERTDYYPGLLLSRKITGKKWEIAVKADYRLNSSNGHWFSSYIWVGSDKIRPSLNHKGMDFAMGAIHEADHGSGSNEMVVFIGWSGGRELARRTVQKDIGYFRIRRAGDDFYIETSEDGVKYEQTLHIKVPVNIDNSTQKIVLGGQCFGNPNGSYVSYDYAKLNGRALF